MLVYGHNGVIAPGGNIVPNDMLVRWIGARLGIDDFGPCVTIGVMQKGELIAVVLYNKYLHPNIEASIASTTPRWCTREHLRGILSYPFLELKCKRITATVPASLEKWRMRGLPRLGFRQEGYHPDVYEDGDAVTYGLLRKDAERWLQEEKSQ